MVTLKTIKGQYIVTAAGEERAFTTMAAALRFIDKYHKSRFSS